MVKENPEDSGGSPGGDRPVLVAVDFSEDSGEALLWACGYAEQAGTEVVVLHVVHDPIDMPGSYRKSDADVLRPIEELAAEMMEKFIKTAAETHPELRAFDGLSTTLVKGIPETRILEIAEKIDARLIVIGSRGLTGLPHLLLGSKAERIAQLSQRPVTIVKRRQKA